VQRFVLIAGQRQNDYMKRGIRFLKILLPGFLALTFTSCMKDKITATYKISVPIYQTLSQFRESIKSQPASVVMNPGKITVYGRYIFLSEPFKGIHVIDNFNPSSPRNVSFINIPGNEDLAVTGNTLYADAYGDLVSFDISNPLNAVAKNFATNVFPDNSIYSTGVVNGGTDINPDDINVIIGWTSHDTTVEYNPSTVAYPAGFSGCANCLTSAAVPAAFTSNNSATTSTTGTNGSMARFSIIGQFLYTVSTSNLMTFDISQPFNPISTGSVQVDYHVETIYPLKNMLFVGTNNGMYMYNVQASPSNPSLVGEFTHVRGCDPVISDGDYAYVTINDSTACLGFNDELQIINIKDLGNSYMVKSYDLVHPVGLSKDGNNLFICDGRDGLKIYNASDVNNLQLIKQLKDANMYDVVTANGLAIVVANNGLYEYDYSDLNNIHLISKL
jgi:hypothetical protein